MRLLTPALLLATFSAVAQTWTQLPDFPGVARDDGASFSIDGTIYVGTGMDAGFQVTNDWYRFNTATEQWSPVAAMPCSPRQYCTGFTIVDTGYVFGGVDANGALAELWAFHPADNTWEPKASIPAEARFACVAVTGFNTNAIVATGMLASGSPTNETWKYDAQTDTWEQIAPVPGPSRHRAACFLDGGGMHIVGGADSVFAPLSDAWSYPIWFETGEWYPATPLPEPRFSADGSWGIAGAVIGGATGSAQAGVHADAWRLNGTAWSPLPDFPGGPRRGGIAASGIDGVWTSTVYYGTGSDNVQRYSDWWMLEYPVGMHEPDAMVCTLSPVPSDASIRISFAHPATLRSIIITDIHGRVLMRAQVSDRSVDVHTAHLANGLYIMEVWNGTERSCQRFTVQH